MWLDDLGMIEKYNTEVVLGIRKWSSIPLHEARTGGRKHFFLWRRSGVELRIFSLVCVHFEVVSGVKLIGFYWICNFPINFKTAYVRFDLWTRPELIGFFGFRSFPINFWASYAHFGSCRASWTTLIQQKIDRFLSILDFSYQFAPSETFSNISIQEKVDRIFRIL